MTGLQFSDIATRSGRSHSLHYHMAEAIRNSLKLYEFSFIDFIYVCVCVYVSSYLKPLDHPQVPTMKQPTPHLHLQAHLCNQRFH